MNPRVIKSYVCSLFIRQILVYSERKCQTGSILCYNDVMKVIRVPRYWPFVVRIQQWHGNFDVFLDVHWTICWTNHGVAYDFRRHGAHMTPLWSYVQHSHQGDSSCSTYRQTRSIEFQHVADAAVYNSSNELPDYLWNLLNLYRSLCTILKGDNWLAHFRFFQIKEKICGNFLYNSHSRPRAR